MLAGSAVVHIRWVPHLCGHPVVQQPPCFPASTGPLRRRRRRRRLAAAYRPLLINYDYTCGSTHTYAYTQPTPTQTHKHVCCTFVKWHTIHTRTSYRHRSEGMRRKSERGSLRGLDRLAAWLPMETTYGRGARGAELLGCFRIYFIKTNAFTGFWRSLNALNIQWKTKNKIDTTHGRRVIVWH